MPRDRTSRFALPRAWLEQYDQSHACFKRRDGAIFPTRSLEELGFSPGWIRLVLASERKSNHYIALSHRWGGLTEAQKMFCTSTKNLEDRRQAFHVSELPKTFRDAVKVVRAMGLKYLWIDSLCIIQSGDDGQDWKVEVTRMENVFSEAYCVIAATAASDSYSGFFDIYNEVESFRVSCPAGQLNVSSNVDDFDRDVGDAEINTRAWVLQESVLARRTVHFTPYQMYWECGKRVYCESLTRLKR